MRETIEQRDILENSRKYLLFIHVTESVVQTINVLRKLNSKKRKQTIDKQANAISG